MAVSASSGTYYFRFERRTAFVLDATAAAASMSLDRALRITSYLGVKVAGGTTGSGTITFTGTDSDGDVLVEAIAFTANGAQQSTGRFASVSSISTVGFTDEGVVPTISVKAISADGTPNLIQYTVAEARPGVYTTLGGRGTGSEWKAAVQGTQELGRVYIDIDYEEVWNPQVGDLVTNIFNLAEVWVVASVHDVRVGFGLRHHGYRVVADKYEV